MRTQERLVTLLRSGNRLVVDPTDERIKKLLSNELAYVERKFYRGYEAKKRRDMRLPVVEEVFWQCFGMDLKDRLGTSYGFRERITALLEKAGYTVACRFATKRARLAAQERAESAFQPRWDRIDEFLKTGFEFRYKQKAALRLIAEHENGRIDCPPGWGKGTVIMLAAMLLPKAKIDVIVKRVPVLRQRLYPELAGNLPSVGIVGGGKKILGRRVMCISADSYRYFRPDADVVLVDEAHEACADGFAERLGVYEQARMYGFSASWNMRLDNKDMRAEAMFGPIRLVVPYEEAEAHNMVVPINIVWSDVVMDMNPCAGLYDVDKKRAGIWANDYRNQLIAKDARHYDRNTQVLITVESLEHALRLKRELPEFKLMFSGASVKPRDWKWFEQEGIMPDNFREMTDARKQKLTRMFEEGRLHKVIATPVWNVGVNFKQLQVLIRADAGGSPVNDTQIPGRTSRPEEEIDKACGIIHDYRDQFDSGFRQKARTREKSYAYHKWTQHTPRGEKVSLLRQLLKLGRKV